VFRGIHGEDIGRLWRRRARVGKDRFFWGGDSKCVFFVVFGFFGGNGGVCLRRVWLESVAQDTCLL